jgi:hypothetical protein
MLSVSSRLRRIIFTDWRIGLPKLADTRSNLLPRTTP